MKQTKKLNLNDLTVDSFDTLGIPTPDVGTIKAHEYSWTNDCETCRVTCNGADTCNTCPGTGQSDLGGCGATNYWENTCGDQYTCNNHSCRMTGAGCNCNYTEGACTWGVQETCAGWNPPCPT
jgi:hypothetical protein